SKVYQTLRRTKRIKPLTLSILLVNHDFFWHNKIINTKELVTMTVNIDDTVRAHYNSGVYIGTVKEDRGDRFLVEVLAVLKHPMQEDLHHPGVADGENVFFHSRKALAHYEKMNVTKAVVYPYEETIPDYHESLQSSLATMKEKLTQ